MYNFIDLIARAYLEYTKEKEDNIAHFFFQEYYTIRPEANANIIFNKELFYKKLIKNIDNLINSTFCNTDPDTTYYCIITSDEDDFENYEQRIMEQHQSQLYNMGINYVVKKTNWEELENANELRDAFNNGLNLINPITIISPSKEIQSNDMVLRKSKLEYLKTEAIRAKEANSINDLTVNNVLSNLAINISDIPNNFNDSQAKKEMASKEIISKSLEIIKPLGGCYILEAQLDDNDMNRLNEYVGTLILTGNLPMNTLLFPTISLSNQFIRKTLHMVFEATGKKNKAEFIKLIHLFKQFEDTESTTTSSKFSTYEGNYEGIKSKITI